MAATASGGATTEASAIAGAHGMDGTIARTTAATVSVVSTTAPCTRREHDGRDKQDQELFEFSHADVSEISAVCLYLVFPTGLDGSRF